RGAAKPAMASSIDCFDADEFGCSISRSTAGEIEDGARAERAFFRPQPSHEGSDFLRFSQPAQRDLRKHVVDMVRPCSRSAAITGVLVAKIRSGGIRAGVVLVVACVVAALQKPIR